MRRIFSFLLVIFLFSNLLVAEAQDASKSVGASVGSNGGYPTKSGGFFGAVSGFLRRPVQQTRQGGCPLRSSRPLVFCKPPSVNKLEYVNGCKVSICVLPTKLEGAPWFRRAQNSYENLLGSYYYIFTSEGDIMPVTSTYVPPLPASSVSAPEPMSINIYYPPPMPVGTYPIPTDPATYPGYVSETATALLNTYNNPLTGMSQQTADAGLNISQATNDFPIRYANDSVLLSIAQQVNEKFADAITKGLVSPEDMSEMAQKLNDSKLDPRFLYDALVLAESLSLKEQKPIEKAKNIIPDLVKTPKIDLITNKRVVSEEPRPTGVPEEKKESLTQRIFPSEATVRQIIRTLNTYVRDIPVLKLFFSSPERFKPVSMPVSVDDNWMYLAQSANRDKQLATKSYYQDQYWKKVNNVSDYVTKAIPSALSYSGINNGSFTSAGGINYFNEANNIQPNMVACLTDTLQGKINSGILDEELEIYGYLLWFFDETVDAVTRIYNSDLSNNEKIEKMVAIVNGCKKLSKSTFASVTDYKNKILETMNKDILVSAPTKTTKATIDSVEITVYGDFSKVGFENKGKSNNCNTFVNEDGIGAIEWSSPDKAGISDNLKASASTAPNKETKFLKVTNCRFQVPSSAKTVDGIKVKIERATEGGSEVVKDLSVKLVKDGKIIGANNASSTAWTSSDVVGIYGSETDTWGVTWEPRDFNNVQFGVVIAAKNEGVAPATTAATASTATVATTATAKTETAQQSAPTPVETPMNKLVKFIATSALKPGDKNDNVATLQTEILIKVKMGPQAESLASSISKKTVKPGMYGATTADAVFFMKNVLGAWATNNKKTDDADFAQIIKDVKGKNKEFNNATWNGFLKYVKANG